MNIHSFLNEKPFKCLHKQLRRAWVKRSLLTFRYFYLRGVWCLEHHYDMRARAPETWSIPLKKICARHERYKTNTPKHLLVHVHVHVANAFGGVLCTRSYFVLKQGAHSGAHFASTETVYLLNAKA